jgi:hypothetical protein
MKEKRVVTAVKTAVALRNYQRARARALTRLANQYYETYREFLEEEKQRDEVEGKKWHSLDDNARLRVGSTRPSGTGTPTTERVGDGSTSIQSNVGGEA